MYAGCSAVAETTFVQGALEGELEEGSTSDINFTQRTKLVVFISSIVFVCAVLIKILW